MIVLEFGCEDIQYRRIAAHRIVGVYRLLLWQVLAKDAKPIAKIAKFFCGMMEFRPLHF